MDKTTSHIECTNLIFCTTCFKRIQESDPHIIAFKNDIPAYFCREHLRDAEKYLDWFQEFVEIKVDRKDAY